MKPFLNAAIGFALLGLTCAALGACVGIFILAAKYVATLR